jgi:hypothetical protein
MHAEGTRFPEFSWDLRTLITVFPRKAPFRFLNINQVLGLTGLPFDRAEQWKGSDPRDAFDLQMCLEGRQHSVSFKKYHSIARELSYEPNRVRFQLGERLRFEGRWPSFQVDYAQPEDALELSIRFDSWPDLQWWACMPRLYCHYTSFGDCHISWNLQGKTGELDLPMLHDHGWGKNFLPLRVPLKIFRYEVLRLPQGGFAISLWTEGPAGIELACVGVIRLDKTSGCFMERYDCRVIEWETFYNYAKEGRRVPGQWKGRLQAPGGEFIYEARRTSQPRPLLGDGFMYGFEYRGQTTVFGLGNVEGEGYVEQMGDLSRYCPS